MQEEQPMQEEKNGSNLKNCREDKDKNPVNLNNDDEEDDHPTLFCFFVSFVIA